MPRKELPYEQREYVTVPEAMTWLGLSRAAINSRVEGGRYRFTMDGTRLKLNVRSILADLQLEAVNAC